MSFFNEIEPYVEQFVEGFADSGFGFSLFNNVGPSALSVATYVLTSLALYAVAKRRGIRNAWLSWVPLVNCWIIGCISDQYRYVVKGEVKNKRKALLTLNIIYAVMAVVMVVVAMVFFGIVMTIVATQNDFLPNGAEMADVLASLFDTILIPLIVVAVLTLVWIGIGIATSVVHYMATYDIYTSCTPRQNVLFLLLSVFFPVTEPFFLFFTRKKDEGMPPRRQEPQYIPQEPQYIPQEPQQVPPESVDL